MHAFHTTRRIEFVDTDMAGIVHFSNFFRFMESAEVSFLQSLGISVRMAGDDETIGFPRVSAACDFFRPVTFGDTVEIAVRIENLGTKSVTYVFDFSHDDQPVAKGRVTTVCCREFPDHHLEAIEIPDRVRAKLRSAIAASS
jgi:YbgC/YbaW family acyl-CoA thioester hydrolase